MPPDATKAKKTKSKTSVTASDNGNDYENDYDAGILQFFFIDHRRAGTEVLHFTPGDEE